MNNQNYIKLIDWATGSDTGMSSNALVRFMMGFKSTYWGFMAPSDSDDRGRCIRVLNLIPEWWDRLHELEEFDGWREQIPLMREESK